MLKKEASAPGSCMLMGEHAVLHGHPAICLALDSKITASVTPRKDKEIHIKSELGEWIGEIDELPTDADFAYVSGAIRLFDGIIKWGFDLTITSQFPVKSGLGSSTAVVVAVIDALTQSLEHPIEKESLFKQSLAVIRDVQNAASGADVAASVYGGCVYYQNEETEVLPHYPKVDLIFSGTKVPTKFVVEEVNRNDPGFLEDVYTEMEAAVIEARKSIINQNWNELALQMFENQRLMEELGLDTPELTLARETMMQKPNVIAAKISGAGMGDYVIGLISG